MDSPINSRSFQGCEASKRSIRITDLNTGKRRHTKATLANKTEDGECWRPDAPRMISAVMKRAGGRLSEPFAASAECRSPFAACSIMM